MRRGEGRGGGDEEWRGGKVEVRKKNHTNVVLATNTHRQLQTKTASASVRSTNRTIFPTTDAIIKG